MALAESSPSPAIYYVLAVPDWDEKEVTPFQGFAPGLIPFVPLMEWIPTLPADIYDPLLDLDDRLARRRAGAGAWLWSPVNLSTLLAKRKPTPQHPFMVLFSADQKTAQAISDWRECLRLKPIHISFFRGGGAIHPANFTQETLRQHLVSLTRKAAKISKDLDVKEHLNVLESWKIQIPKSNSLKFHSHNVTRPNEMVLVGSGEESPQDEDGHLHSSPHEDYVRGISESVEAVMALWKHTKDRPGYLVNPPRPDMFLIAPATYRGISKRLERGIDNPLVKSALRSLDRQRDYTIKMALNVDDEEDGKAEIDLIGPILALRGGEMKLTTTAVGLRTAGTVAATLRLPPAVNRTGGVVGQLARFLRTHENPPPIKAARVFKKVQDALREYIPDEHLKLIAKSQTGIKIIADAPIEWIPIDGLPLGIRFDVSRINSTPGNLFLGQIRPPIPLYIPPKAFRQYLVLSMFEDGDPIAPHLRLGALGARDGDDKPIIGEFMSPKTVKEFGEAIASFNGPMLIIDSHAVHKDETVPGGLVINDVPFDVWTLAGKISMPPIVILSACDTHPFDRNHATVANGFLACGAMAVVATALPIRAPAAARFIMRLITRAVHYGGIVNGMGLSVPWTHIVSGVLRMELATDIIRTFSEKGHYDKGTASELLLQSNRDLNPLNPSWYERMIERVRRACQPTPHGFEGILADIIAASDAIRYLHLGNPEAILVADHHVKSRALDQAGLIKEVEHSRS